jgi:hypothetical protein
LARCSKDSIAFLAAHPLAKDAADSCDLVAADE